MKKKVIYPKFQKVMQRKGINKMHAYMDFHEEGRVFDIGYEDSDEAELMPHHLDQGDHKISLDEEILVAI